MHAASAPVPIATGADRSGQAVAQTASKTPASQF